MPSLEQPSAERRREILSRLPRQQLQRLTNLYNLEVADRRKISLYVEALVSAEIDFHILLGLLDHDQARELAKTLKLDLVGNPDKQQLIDAILAEENAGSAGVPPASEQLKLSELPPSPTEAKKAKAKKSKKARRKSRPEHSSHAELLHQLWEAAVNLRGSIEPSSSSAGWAWTIPCS